MFVRIYARDVYGAIREWIITLHYGCYFSDNAETMHVRSYSMLPKWASQIVGEVWKSNSTAEHVEVRRE